jgi:quaternary ammonium compound-resistance protein SugE
MTWLYLIIAGLLEVGWAIGLKYSAGFTRLWPSAFTMVAMIASIVFLAQALKAIPVGTGYAVWTGIGAIGIAVLGIVLFSESTNPGRLLSIALIVVGIIGLKLTSGTSMAG